MRPGEYTEAHLLFATHTIGIFYFIRITCDAYANNRVLIRQITFFEQERGVKRGTSVGNKALFEQRKNHLLTRQ